MKAYIYDDRHTTADIRWPTYNGQCTASQKVVGPGLSVEFLPYGGSLKVLGTMLSLKNVTETELVQRISSAWASFHSLRQMLLHPDAPLRARLRLFDTTVGASMLWCSETWTLRETDKRSIRSTQNCMLRKIVAPRRAPGEDYVDWVKRATAKAKKHANFAGIRWWVEAHARSKWFFASSISMSPWSSWLKKICHWRDATWKAPHQIRRSRSGPWTRWETSLVKHANKLGVDNWHRLAQDPRKWASLVDGYVKATA